MSCSKEVRIPSDWAFLKKEVFKEEIDPELFNVDELVKWFIETEAGDETTIRKYVKVIGPYYFARCIYVVPKNRLCREAFKVFTYTIIGLYLVDDVMEKECDYSEVEKICSEYDKLDEKLCEIFPKVPTLQDLKTLLKFQPSTKLRGPILTCMNLVNRVTALILKDGNVSEKVALDFRRLLSNTASLFLKGVKFEKKTSTESTENEILWSRITAGAPLVLAVYVEISSFVMGKIPKELAQAVVEMYVVSSLLSIIVNDLYSFHRETTNAIPGDNVIKFWLRKKEITSMPEAIVRCTRIVNAVMQYTYDKVENVKTQYPENPEIHTLFLHIAHLTTGWILYQDQSGRYKDSPWRLSLANVKEDEVQQWLADKDSYGVYMLDQFLATNTKAKKIIDVLLGAIADIRDELLSDTC